MYVLENPTATSNWFVDLKDHNQVEQALPMDTINVRNDSDKKVYLNLWGRRVGQIQRYSSDSFGGRNFEEFRLYSPNGDIFNPGDLFVQISKGQVMTSQPFNPQWDMLETNFDGYAQGCDARISYSDTVPAGVIKYRLNQSNGLIVQRALGFMGGASVGAYMVDFEGDEVAGGVPINFPYEDKHWYRKKIKNHLFDYEFTDCDLKRWMIDYKEKTIERRTGGTLQIDPGNGANALDEDPSNASDWETVTTDAPSWDDIWQLKFDDFGMLNTVDLRIGVKSALSGSDVGVCAKILSIRGGGYYALTLSSDTTDSDSEKIFDHHSSPGVAMDDGHPLYITISGQRLAGQNADIRIYDVTVT